ncbi:MAG: hypothetical protein IJF12_02020 [Alphaproteobacteria bacterium]|nr:hypothetical protein [Alphaproteobacteria bacterium]
MRKYFLLSAVAMLVATNVNAATNVNGNVEIQAKIEHVNQITCSPLNFGTIYIKSNNALSTISLDGSNYTTTGDVVTVQNAIGGYCTDIDKGGTTTFNLIDIETEGGSVYLTGARSSEETGDQEAWVSDIVITDTGDVNGKLWIPENFPAATLEGSFTFVGAYE